MIKLQDYTPEVYYKESRDFQLLGHLFDLVLNAVKTDVDLMYNIPLSDNSDDKLLDLVALTLGFKTHHSYNAKHLRAICRVFPKIIKNKGSIEAIIIACNALFAVDSIKQQLDYEYTFDNNSPQLTLYIPEEFNDILLLNDILKYVLPAGIGCNIIKEYQDKHKMTTKINVYDTFTLLSTNEDHSTESQGIFYDNNLLAKLPRLNLVRSNQTFNVNQTNMISSRLTISSENSSESTAHGTIDISKALHGLIEDNLGFSVNGAVYKPKKGN